MAAVTLGLQAAVALASLAFGLLALTIHRRTPGAAPAHRAAWLLVGSAFTVHGVSFLGQTIFGSAAQSMGPESAVYAQYMKWNPAMNHSRTFLLLALTCIIIALAVVRNPSGRRFTVAGWGLMAAGFAGGAVVGLVEPDFTELVHYSAVATWDVVQLVLLLVALFLCLLRSRLDRFAWLALSLYGFRLALNIMWIAALSRTNVPGEWSPRPWMIHAYRLVLTLAIVAVAARRLQLARRNVSVGALLEAPSARLTLVG